MPGVDDTTRDPPADDPLVAWRLAMARVVDLVTGVEPDRMESRVPACPDWTARELLSHVVGLGASVLAGDEPADHDATWTQGHVEARRDRSVADLVREWYELAEDLVVHMREHGPRPLADVTIHEHDLRGALDREGAHDTAGLRIVRRWMLDRLDQRVRGLPPLALDAGRWSWTSAGSGVDVERAAVLLRADGFDLDRAIVSRRTADQLRSFPVRGDVEPYLDSFAVLGPLPTEPLAGG